MVSSDGAPAPILTPHPTPPTPPSAEQYRTFNKGNRSPNGDWTRYPARPRRASDCALAAAACCRSRASRASGRPHEDAVLSPAPAPAPLPRGTGITRGARRARRPYLTRAASPAGTRCPRAAAARHRPARSRATRAPSCRRRRARSSGRPERRAKSGGWSRRTTEVRGQPSAATSARLCDPQPPIPSSSAHQLALMRRPSVPAPRRVALPACGLLPRGMARPASAAAAPV